jgi:hypothetical protein
MTVANYAENKILDALFNNVSLAVATPYIKLHIGDPGEDCTANAAVETTRKLVSFGVAASGQVASDAARGGHRGVHVRVAVGCQHRGQRPVVGAADSPTVGQQRRHVHDPQRQPGGVA